MEQQPIPSANGSQHKLFTPRSVALLLIDGATLTRESMAEGLRTGAPDFIVRSVAHVTDAMVLDINPDIIVLNCKTHSLQGRMVSAEAARITASWPTVPRLLISESMSHPVTALNAVRLGWHGYLQADQGMELLIAAIRLVSLGGISLPAQAFDFCISRCQNELE